MQYAALREGWWPVKYYFRINEVEVKKEGDVFVLYDHGKFVEQGDDFTLLTKKAVDLAMPPIRMFSNDPRNRGGR